MASAFRHEGIEVLTGHKAKRFAIVDGEKTLFCEADGSEVRVAFDTLLCAVGRTANTEGYGLEALGIPVSRTRTVEVDVLFTNPEDRARLLVGYSADVDLVLETRPEVLRIPTEALLDDDTVYRLASGAQRVERVKVQPGIRNWNWSEVQSGLAAGDRVVVSLDVPGLADGARVVARDP